MVCVFPSSFFSNVPLYIAILASTPILLVNSIPSFVRSAFKFCLNPSFSWAFSAPGAKQSYKNIKRLPLTSNQWLIDVPPSINCFLFTSFVHNMYLLKTDRAYTYLQTRLTWALVLISSNKFDIFSLVDNSFFKNIGTLKPFEKNMAS